MKANFFPSPAPTPAAYLRAARLIKDAGGTGLRSVRVAVLSSDTVEVIRPYLVVESARLGFAFQPWFAPWGQIEQQALDDGSDLHTEDPDVVLVLARLEEWSPELCDRFLLRDDNQIKAARKDILQRLENLLSGLRKYSDAVIFFANFVPPLRVAAGMADLSLRHCFRETVQGINGAVRKAVSRVPGAYTFDLAQVAIEHGLANWCDPRLAALARVPLSLSAQIATCKAFSRVVHAALVPPAKVLVLDLDNTLWGGVLGEDGFGGIQLGNDHPGNVYKAFQQYLLNLRDSGILLAIASKNNPADVDEFFDRYPDRVLQREDFAACRVNWNDKSDSLREIAEELNVDLDALAFFDDSPFEREQVAHHLPMVRVIDVPESALEYSNAVDSSAVFDRLTLTSEDRDRSALYIKQKQRLQPSATTRSRGEFLLSLEMVATVGLLANDQMPRVAQLLAKTNQFNLTTRRHSAVGMDSMLRGGAIGLWLRLADRFGDQGLVGFALAVPESPTRWRLDSFLLSCRVIGRDAETALLATLAGMLRQRGIQELRGEYIPTPKNAPVADFFSRHLFAASEGGEWILDLAASPISIPAHIRVAPLS